MNKDISMHLLLSVFLVLTLVNLSSTAASIATNQVTHDHDRECVILLHGLARTSNSMKNMEENLNSHGYVVVNIGYPSRSHKIAKLSSEHIPEALVKCVQFEAEKIHFVTHSMGGILIRYYLSQHSIVNLGRVVMLSPPNQGSEVVDTLKHIPGFYLLNGPAGQQLGTDSASVPLSLGAADFDLGIITGDASINLLLSLIIPGDDDGKVSIERAKLKGMQDFLVLPYSHPFIMKRKPVLQQVSHYLHHGSFVR